MVKDSYGLVLAGGGTKGAFHIGAWIALEELGLFNQITGISGSSIGAFNTALFAQKNLGLARSIWEQASRSDFANLNLEMILDKMEPTQYSGPAEALERNLHLKETGQKAANLAMDKMDEVLARLEGVQIQKDTSKDSVRNYAVWFFRNLCGDGYATPDRLKEILDDNIDFEFIQSQGMDLYSTICRWNADTEVSGKAEYISWKNLSKEQILNLIMTSAALPVLYPEVPQAGDQYLPDQLHSDTSTYVDGGYADNQPIRPLYEAGYRKIIVLYLDKFKGKHLARLIEEEESQFPDAEILRVFPGKGFNDSFRKGIVINQKLTLSRIECGYRDTIQCLEEQLYTH